MTVSYQMLWNHVRQTKQKEVLQGMQKTSGYAILGPNHDEPVKTELMLRL